MAPVESTAPPPMTEKSSAATQPAQNDEDARGQPAPAEIDAPPVQAEPEPMSKPDDEQSAPTTNAPTGNLADDPDDPGRAGEDAQPMGQNVVTFPVRRSRRGRKERNVFGPDSIYIDPVQSSKNKWTFRVRWIEPDNKRPILTARALSVADYIKLKRSKKNYEAYVAQLIAVCRARALRAGHGTNRRAGGIS